MRKVVNEAQQKFTPVSILLVVELAFEEVVNEAQQKFTPVSILLVVELAFEDLNRSIRLVLLNCFNPSCSGIGF